MNFDQWKESSNQPTLKEAFNVGYEEGFDAKEDHDPRDVIIARLSIENERLKEQIKELHKATQAAKESMLVALREFDKLRFGYF